MYTLLRPHFTSCECNAVHVCCLRSQTMCAASVSAAGAGCDPGSHLAVAAAPTYIGGHILRSPPPSQSHILTITTMSTIIIVTKVIFTYQAAGAGCDPGSHLTAAAAPVPPWISNRESISSGHHNHNHLRHVQCQ